MSSFALTAVAGISSALMDHAFTTTASQTGETTVRFGDGLHGAAPPLGHCSTLPANYATGGGASGNADDAAPQPLEDRPLLRSGYGVEFGAVGRHFSGVLMQQGRVQTDADYNEATTVPAFAPSREAPSPVRHGEHAGPGASADEQSRDHLSATGSLRPQVGDEVLVAFEHGQMRPPFVVAPLWSPVDKPPTSDGAVDVTQADLASASSRLDSMSEMGETESLRLQMAMDRLSKMMSTLSNLLHRVDTTNAAITQNIK